MVTKLLNLFINKGVHKDTNLLFKFRFLVLIILLFIIFDAIVGVLQYAELYQDFFNYKLYGLALLVILFTLKLSTNIQLASLLFLLFSFGLNLMVINLSGGIYSYDIKWLVLIILMSIILNYKVESKIPLICMVITLLAIVYFYHIESYEHRTDFLNKQILTKTDYLVENFIYVVFFSSVFFFYYRLHNGLLKEIREKNEVLKQQHQLNVTKTNELRETKIKLEESNRDLKSYAYATSHDLKEPLRTITSFTQLLKRELREVDLSPAAEEYLNYVELGGSRMYHLVEDALILSKVDKLTKGSFEKLNINTVVEEVLKDLYRKINETGATVIYKKLPDVSGNRLEIKRLFKNLISNAIKFAKEGVPPVIRINYELKNNKQIFSIADNGKGVKPENLKTIFEPYKKMDNTMDGSGFGLAICKKIVELHEGDIWAESEGNSGTIFKFSIAV